MLKKLLSNKLGILTREIWPIRPLEGVQVLDLLQMPFFLVVYIGIWIKFVIIDIYIMVGASIILTAMYLSVQLLLVWDTRKEVLLEETLGKPFLHWNSYRKKKCMINW